MTLPSPKAGLVIRYAYLWRSEHLEGREEGVKDRPCAIVLTTQHDADGTVVTVLPVTHSPPTASALALEIPQAMKQRLGLDSARSWIVFSEANRFVWPGPDLRALPGRDLSSVAYGMLPPNFFIALRDRYLAAIRTHKAKNVPR